MNKWADYLISSVSYTPERLISGAIRHEDTEKGITNGEQVDRITLTSDIKHGLSYITIYSGKDSWKKGYKLKIFSIDGEYYLRIDGNKAKLDYLGDIPEIPLDKYNSDKETSSKQIKALESKPSPAKPSEVTKPKGVLPKQSSDELPQELDLAPEPITESDDATPEQLQRLEQLEKQIKQLSRKVKSKKPSSKKSKKS
ncbi:hypothetical protein [Candidatus Nitrosarchaeum limnium]|uniref:DUF3892 domain-containing protein n=1 Tax=Candidatus Nitrosarchaeum limnium BG20 TaxID=859192 RepID=S2EAW4_9ARCH|nr:hypothetical protein [Candidatus Nitrosarchaeum limnium]EPA06506.1 hypothetical protein BG20_I1432 [Candidatus Nitrosarchaeum limnium BG20]